jgi:hypothetical protein
MARSVRISNTFDVGSHIIKMPMISTSGARRCMLKALTFALQGCLKARPKQDSLPPSTTQQVKLPAKSTCLQALVIALHSQ